MKLESKVQRRSQGHSRKEISLCEKSLAEVYLLWFFLLLIFWSILSRSTEHFLCLNPFSPKQNLLPQNISNCLGVCNSWGNWALIITSLSQELVCLSDLCCLKVEVESFPGVFMFYSLNCFHEKLCSTNNFIFSLRLWQSPVLWPGATSKFLIF